MLFIWRVYVLFLSWLTLGEYVSTRLHYTGLPHVFDYLDLAETVLEFMGVYGYVFGFQSFNHSFWKIVAPCAFVWDIVLSVVEPGSMNLSQSLIGIVLAVPMYIALYCYAFRANHIWNREGRSNLK